MWGDGFAAHVDGAGTIDQTARFGGLPNGNLSFASVPSKLTSVAVNGAGEVLVGGSLQPTASAGVLKSETYDVPLRNAPTAAFPSQIGDAQAIASTCHGSLCAGSAGYLAELDPRATGAALTLSMGDAPLVVVRNLGSDDANGLQLAVSAGGLTTNCPQTLHAGGECDVLLSGGQTGVLTVSATNSTQSAGFAAYAAPAATIVSFPRELDFGIQTAGSAPGSKTITVTNLGPASQMFVSALDASANPKAGTVSPFGEVASDCTLAGSATQKVLPAGGTCHITLGFTAGDQATSDGWMTADWTIGGSDVRLTGYSQAAALSVSAPEIDFGTRFSNGLKLPRFLYLSNGSGGPVAHAPVALPAGSAFTLTDGCPGTLAAGSVCRLRIDYQASQTTSVDAVTLALDQGLSVLLTGTTLPPQTVTGTTVNPNLLVTPGSLAFGNAVPVTAVSSTTQTVTVTNTGASAFPLTVTLGGDFTDTSSCGVTLRGGQSCTVEVTFTPSEPGPRQGLLTVTAGSSFTPAYVSLSGLATAILPANNGTLNLGSVAVGEPLTLFYKIAQPFGALTASATGAYSVVLVEDVGFGPGQPAAGLYAGSTTASCRNCFLGLRFQPTAVGTQTGTLTLSSAQGGAAYVLRLTGSGVASSGVVLTPAVQDFGTVPVHSFSGAQTLTLTNLTPSAVASGGAALTGDFVGLGGTCGGMLGVGDSCTVKVAFAPSATGARTGTLAVAGVSAGLNGSATADPGIAIDPTAITFENVAGITATRQDVRLTNTTGAAVLVGMPGVASAHFQIATGCGTLAAGASCTISVGYTPGTATLVDVLSIPISSTAGAAVTTLFSVALNGSYTSVSAGLELVPDVIDFGPIDTAQETLARQFTVSNLTAKSLAVDIEIPRQFVWTSAPCGALAAGDSCTFSVAFLPLTNGEATGTLFARGTPSDGSPGLNSLAYTQGFGLGTGVLSLSGGPIVNGVDDFGQVPSGQSASQTFTLTNRNPAGNAAITVRRVTSAPPFLSTTNCGSSLTVGQSCTVIVTYTPSNQVGNGTVSPPVTADAGLLVIESDAASSPAQVNLRGSGSAVAVSNPANSTPLATFTLSQESLTFPLTMVGRVSAPETVTLFNTGTSTIHVGRILTTGDFTVGSGCGAVLPGANCFVVVSASPQSPGAKVAALEIPTDAAVSLEFVSLLSSASPPILTLSPASLDFGSVQVGAAATLPVQVVNTGSLPVVFGSISATGDFSAAGSCPGPGNALAGNSSCTVQVAFRPTGTGARSGVLAVASSASTNPLIVPLTGVGAQSLLQVAPGSLAFGTIVTGAAASLSVTLTNAGTAPVTKLALTITGDYAVTTPCPQTTLAPGASCTVQVTFTPAAIGPQPGALTVTSSDLSSPRILPLSGTGIQGGSFTLTVNGASTASASVTSGRPATFSLLVMPVGGFSGSVALTCAPVLAAPYASCSLSPATMILSGAGQTSMATINTVTSVSGSAQLEPGSSSVLRGIFFCVMMPGLWTLWRGRGALRRRRSLLVAMLLSSCAVFALGCGGRGDFNLRYTPAGTYQYQVTASSTSGVAVTQTVTLNLIVTPR